MRAKMRTATMRRMKRTAKTAMMMVLLGPVALGSGAGAAGAGGGAYDGAAGVANIRVYSPGPVGAGGGGGAAGALGARFIGGGGGGVDSPPAPKTRVNSPAGAYEEGGAGCDGVGDGWRIASEGLLPRGEAK